MGYRFRDQTTWSAIDRARDIVAEQDGTAEAIRRKQAWIEARAAELEKEAEPLRHDRVVAVQTRITEAIGDLMGDREVGREYALSQRDRLWTIDEGAQRRRAYEQACKEADKIDFRVSEEEAA
ncbi:MULTISPECIES: hypothetical protein [Hyphobacterium]|uniref:Uncharacterized protein n=1 Tax=Hyphobacterium vulgare TaxID=1736751 RepID=A0ABV6ZUD8_9PROT